MDWITWVVASVTEYFLTSFKSWESLVEALARVPGVFTDLDSRMAWPYLLTSLAAAAAVYCWTETTDRRGCSVISFLFPRSVYLHISAILDYKFFCVDTVLRSLIYVPIASGVGAVGFKLMSAILIGGLAWEPPVHLSPARALFTAFGFFVWFDFTAYVGHLLLHKVPVLWAFHRVHHSAQVLTPFTALRVHPAEFLFFKLLQMPMIGSGAVFFQHVVANEMAVTTVFGVGIFVFLSSMFFHHLAHTHIWLSFSPALNRLLISPAHHQIHHSVEARHRDKNLGLKFAIWDWCFGTLYNPQERERFSVGVCEPGFVQFSSARALYVRPFKDSVIAMKQASRRRRLKMPVGAVSDEMQQSAS